MAQRLRALADPAEEPSSVPNLHTQILTVICHTGSSVEFSTGNAQSASECFGFEAEGKMLAMQE
ncbi:Uncharacterised protein [Chlamydia trachomatis]|nr:Uncharacterised protein [Chlamydia trachomatis]